MTGRTIVLAHGILGFGEFTIPFINYFNGVAAHVHRRSGHTVIAPQVNPIGSVAHRGGELATVILAQPKASGKLHVVAHSMGGLDARHAITNVHGVSERVATLVTIGTPHRGSPVADAIVKGTGPILEHIPHWLKEQLQSNSEGLRDLTTVVASQFDVATPDVHGVRYVEVAGDASRGGHELFLFSLAAAIGQIEGINDGVVTRASALRNGHEHLPDWPVDHAGEVGWSVTSPVPIEVELPLVPAPPHFARYDAIVDAL